MRRFAVAALIVAGLSLSAFAQRHAGAARGGGFASRPASRPAFRASASAGFSTPARGVGAPRFSAPRWNAPRFGSRPQQPGANPLLRSGGSRFPVGRLGDRRDGHHRRLYISSYAANYPYAYGPWLTPGYPTVLDYDDDYDDSGAQQGAATGAYPDQGYGDDGGYGAAQDAGPPPGAQYLGPWPGTPPANAAPPAPQPSATFPDDGITLIFKDGRPAMHAHNYVLTRNAIFVGDARGVTIPLSQLDLDATAKANRDAGVDFEIPRVLN